MSVTELLGALILTVVSYHHPVRCYDVVLGFMGIDGGTTTERLLRYQYMGAALPLAIADAQAAGIFFNASRNDTVTYIMQPSQCDQKVALVGLVTLMQQANVSGHRLSGIIGPECSTAVLSAGLLASAWALPMVGYSAQSESLSSKATYDTFVRVNTPFSMFAQPIGSLLVRYNWTNVGLVTSSTLGPLSYVRQGVLGVLAEMNVSYTEAYIKPSPFYYSSSVTALKTLSEKSRGNV